MELNGGPSHGQVQRAHTGATFERSFYLRQVSSLRPIYAYFPRTIAKMPVPLFIRGGIVVMRRIRRSDG